MARLPDPFSTLTPDAKRVYDKITAKRGQMRGGPFASLMHHPALAEKVGDLGISAVRRNTPRRHPRDGHPDHRALGQSGVRVGGARPDRAHREAAGRRHRADPDAG